MLDLPRQFWLLSIGTFVYLIGIDMCFPFETIFLNRSLGVPMTTVGLILGISLLATLPMQVVGGVAADRFGRRPVLMVAILASMALYLGLGLTRQLWLIVVLLFVEAALGWAQYITASNAMVADLTSLERRAEAFSITRVALNGGMVLGPLLAAPLIASAYGFRLSFFVGGLICGVFLLLVVTLFKETRPAGLPVESLGTALRGYGAVLRHRRFLLFCIVALFPLYSFGQIWVTLPIMLEDVHGVSAETWGILMAVYAASTALLSYPAVRLLSRYDHMVLLALASTSIGAGMTAAAFLPGPGTVASVLALSFGVVLLMPICATVVSEMAPPALRGRYMGAWTLVYMGGYALGPLFGGWALDRMGGRGAFLVNGVVGLVGAGLFLLLRRGPTAALDAVDQAELLAELPPGQTM